MSTKTAYTYTVLRYVHDIASGECLNVGVALLAPEQHFVNAQCRTSFARLKEVFPTLDGDAFRAAMRHVNNAFERFQQELREELALRSHQSGVLGYAHAVLGPDDSSLQWSPMGSGVTADAEATLDQLYRRFVLANERPGALPRRHEDDVWRHFSRELQQRQVLRHFVPKTIAVRDDQLEFKHAWKNGIWHCLAPVSFDLASAESIRDKAHKWLGQLTSVAGSPDRFKLYFLTAEPSQAELRPAYEAALSILTKAQAQSEVFAERDAAGLAERLMTEVTAHGDGVGHRAA